jgi:hypothetical protein
MGLELRERMGLELKGHLDKELDAQISRKLTQIDVQVKKYMDDDLDVLPEVEKLREKMVRIE